MDMGMGMITGTAMIVELETNAAARVMSAAEGSRKVGTSEGTTWEALAVAERRMAEEWVTPAPCHLICTGKY